MYTDNVEAAYFISRAERSRALARAATEACARLAHQELADLYGERVIRLKRPKSAPPPLAASSTYLPS
jgi:hypothetical protein